MTYIRLPKLHPLHERIALTHYERGLTPEQSLAALKAAKYIVSQYIVDAIVVANILRGLHLAQTIKPARKTRTKKSA